MEFDPYEQWLQIPPGRRPASYYDLVGVSAEETDGRRIDAAATRRYEHVRKYVLGPQGEQAHRILSELSRAVSCLTDPKRREQYDRRRIRESVRRWLTADQQPADFYELLDQPRFLPDRERLLSAIWVARRALAEPQPNAAAARRLRAELHAGETALGDPGAYEWYHRSMLARLCDQYTRQHGDDRAQWDVGRLQAWLEQEQCVSPGRVEAILEGLCGSQSDVLDRLLDEMFPWEPARPRKPPPLPCPPGPTRKGRRTRSGRRLVAGLLRLVILGLLGPFRGTDFFLRWMAGEGNTILHNFLRCVAVIVVVGIAAVLLWLYPGGSALLDFLSDCIGGAAAGAK